MKNNKEGLPLLKRMGNQAYKIFTFFTIIVLLLFSVGIYCCRNLGIGYKYYQMVEDTSSLIGITQTKNLIENTRQEYLELLEHKGYYIVTSEFDVDMFAKQVIVRNKDMKQEEVDNKIKSAVIDNLDIEVLATKLTIEEDNDKKSVFIFKTDNECDSYIKQLNTYIEQKYSKESSIENYKDITKQDVLDAKVKEVMEKKAELDRIAEAERQKKLEEQKKKQQVQTVSRGGVSRTASVSKAQVVNGCVKGVPMASYVYISSPFGMRNGSMHTGTDFAAAAGTEIYSWKSGTVTSAKYTGGYGNFIIVDHHDGTVTRYAHLSRYAVTAGQEVKAGQTIGYVGSTRK